jgi:hypothetical protein
MDVDWKSTLSTRVRKSNGMPDGSVDFIYSTSTLEHIPGMDTRALLLECFRAATPQHPLHEQLSTAQRQPRILIHVHSELLRTCGFGEQQIHRRPPNGQPLNRE